MFASMLNQLALLSAEFLSDKVSQDHRKGDKQTNDFGIQKGLS